MVVSLDTDITVDAVKTFAGNVEAAFSAKPILFMMYIVLFIPVFTYLWGCDMPGLLKATRR